MGPFIVGIGSFVLLCVASWCVGEGGEILGKKYDASIIGGLVIAWLNTAPETIFFITALDSNNPNFAVGAVSGSTIVVCTVALGACLYIGANASKKPISLQPSVKKQCYILMLSLIIPLAISFIGFNLFLGVSGVLYYIGFLYISISKSTKTEPNSDHKDFDLEAGKLGDDDSDDEEEDEEEESTVKGALYLLAGGILIILFSSPFINSIVEISKVWRVSPSLLAFFLAPIASEAPEILESISLSRKGNIQSINIAYSNLIGGTITKTTLLCGIFCFYGYFKEFIWDSPSYSISLMLLSACAGMAAFIGNFVKIQKSSHGVILWVTFIFAGLIQYYFNAGGGLASFELLDGNIVLNNFGVSQGISRV